MIDTLTKKRYTEDYEAVRIIRDGNKRGGTSAAPDLEFPEAPISVQPRSRCPRDSQSTKIVHPTLVKLLKYQDHLLLVTTAHINSRESSEKLEIRHSVAQRLHIVL